MFCFDASQKAYNRTIYINMLAVESVDVERLAFFL